MLLLDKKAIYRKLLVYNQGKQLQVKVAPEGIYFKREKSRWSGALFLPWMSGFVQAAIRHANEQKKLKKERRAAKRLAREDGPSGLKNLMKL